MIDFLEFNKKEKGKMKFISYKDVSKTNIPKDGDVIISGFKQKFKVNHSIIYDEYSLSYLKDNSPLTHFTDLKTFLIQVSELELI